MAKNTIKTDAASRGRRNTRTGFVTKKSSDKTIKVEIVTRVRHEKYGKYLKAHSKFVVHDERNEAQVGDKVEIFETRPLSKSKRWKLSSVLEKGVQEGAAQ